MDIHDKLEEIADHFRKKVIDGDYEFLKCNKYSAHLLVDGKYKFQVWIANDPEVDLDFYETSLIGFNSDHLLSLKTQKARLLAWKNIKPKIDNYRKTTLKRAKQAEFNRLKKELEELI